MNQKTKQQKIQELLQNSTWMMESGLVRDLAQVLEGLSTNRITNLTAVIETKINDAVREAIAKTSKAEAQSPAPPVSKAEKAPEEQPSQALDHFLFIEAHYWGKAKTAEGAIANSKKSGGKGKKAKQWKLYKCTDGTRLDNMGYVCTQAGTPRPVCIDSHGFPPEEVELVIRDVKGGGWVYFSVMDGWIFTRLESAAKRFPSYKEAQEIIDRHYQNRNGLQIEHASAK